MTHTFKVGDQVEIVDGSEAHGDVGRIWIIQDNGVIIVELEECVWPTFASEIRPINGNNREAASTLKTGVVSLSGIEDTPPLCFTLLTNLIEATKAWHSVNDCQVEGRTDCELCAAIKEANAYMNDLGS